MNDSNPHVKCSTCGRWGWQREHRCPPTWKGWVKDYGDEEEDPDTVYATDAEDAAEKLVELLVSRSDGDLDQTQTFEITVLVPDKDPLKFFVTGEYQITWHIREEV